VDVGRRPGGLPHTNSLVSSGGSNRVGVGRSSHVSWAVSGLVRDRLALHDDFAQVIARQEKLHGVEFLEQAFQAAIVEVLGGLAFPA